MLVAKVYSQAGEDKGEEKLNPRIFGVKSKLAVLHQVLVAIMANRRPVIAHTKDRGDVRGGGRKPWRQKGTGRARHGSIRSPLWKGGGVTFGPRNERNFAKKINKKMKTKALFMALSDKVKNDALAVLDNLEMSEIRAKQMADLLKKIKLNKSVLLVIEKMDKTIVCSVRNIPNAEVITASSLNLYDVLKYKNVLFTKAALKKAEEVYLKDASTK